MTTNILARESTTAFADRLLEDTLSVSAEERVRLHPFCTGDKTPSASHEEPEREQGLSSSCRDSTMTLYSILAILRQAIGFQIRGPQHKRRPRPETALLTLLQRLFHKARLKTGMAQLCSWQNAEIVATSPASRPPSNLSFVSSPAIKCSGLDFCHVRCAGSSVHGRLLE